jgi:N-acetylneuraminic acid mutarotase
MRSSETKDKPGDGPARDRSAVVVESLEPRALLHAGHSDFHVQFAPAKFTPADGYVIDAGAVFGQRNTEMSYGWSRKGAAKGVARRDTPESPDGRYDAFVNFKRGVTWELSLPNGAYEVHVVAGDSKTKRGSYGLDVEGTPALRADTTAEQPWAEATVTVTVSDGMLTLQAPEKYKKNRISFIDVVHVGEDPPPVTSPDPTPEPEPPPEPPPDPGTTPAVTLGTWRRGADSPIKRAEAVGAAVGGKLYVLGGISGKGSNFSYPIIARGDAYDPATDTWSRVADMPEPFTHSVGTVDGTTIWFVGGFVGHTPGPGTEHVWKYDTAADVWSRGPDLPDARGGGASAIVGRTLHYFGGANRTRTEDMASHWSLDLDDPNATWVQHADMPMPRNHMAAATVGGKIYAVGGQRGEGADAVDLSEVDAYDPATDSWTSVAAMPGARSHTNCSTFELNGKLIVIGGESGPEQYHNEILSYDPAANAWSVFATLPDARSTTIAGVVNNELVFSTGNAPGQTTDTWIAPLV